jgi:hypothetical protein
MHSLKMHVLEDFEISKSQNFDDHKKWMTGFIPAQKSTVADLSLE